MKQVVLALVVGSLVGGGIGGYAAYQAAGTSQSAEMIAELRGAAPPAVALPALKIDAPVYQFDTMQRGTTRRHAFPITNAGTAPLEVSVGSTTCKCTAVEVPERPIEPGETVEVELEWVAKINAGPFRQTATLLSNDPRAARVDLTVEGTVIDVTGLEPKQWFFDRLQAGEERTESLYLMSYQHEEMNLITARMDYEEDEKLFSIATETIPREQLPDPNALAGVRIDVTSGPQLPIGNLHYWVVVETDLPDAEPLKIPITGKVEGDISIRGPAAWNAETNSVYLGIVPSAEGGEVKLFLSVKGEHSDDIEFSMGEVEPSYLVVELGERRQIREGVTHVPLVVRVPAGAPPTLRLNDEQGEGPGKVVLKTSHPLSPEIQFEVRYGVRR